MPFGLPTSSVSWQPLKGSTMTNFLSRYGEASSIHGCFYVLTNHGQNVIFKVIWLLVIIIAFAFSTHTINHLYQTWRADPDVITIDSTHLSIVDVPYPIVCLCKDGVKLEQNVENVIAVTTGVAPEQHQGDFKFFTDGIKNWPSNTSFVDFFKVMVSNMDSLVKYAMLIKEGSGLSNTSKFDLFLNPNRSKEMEVMHEAYWQELIKFMEVSLDPVIKNPDNFDLIYPFLWAITADPCYRFIKKCYFKLKEIDCNKHFKLIPTNRGPCCAFNMDPSVYRNETAFSRVMKLFMKFFGSEEDLNVRPSSGLRGGLTVILDQQSDMISTGTLVEDYSGFRISVFSKDETPLATDKSLLISPGHVNFVTLSSEHITTDQNVRTSLQPEERRCLYHDELELALFTNYSLVNCVTECLQNLTEKEIGCTPWSLPTISKVICNPYESEEYFDKLAELELSQTELCAQCLPSCKSDLYTARTSAAPIRECSHKNVARTRFCKVGDSAGIGRNHLLGDLIVADYLAKNTNHSDIIKSRFRAHSYQPNSIFEAFDEDKKKYDAFAQDIAVVHVFFDKMHSFSYKKSVKMTWFDFISQVGGTMGLFVGFSLLSMVEILYWIVLYIMSLRIKV